MIDNTNIDNTNMLSASDKTLHIKDSATEDYCLYGYRGKKVDKPEIIQCPYIPLQLSNEEYAKKFLANKKYAFVKYEYPDDKYANKKGKVLDEKVNEAGIKSYLLKINVRQKSKGHIHFVVLKPIYEEVWFEESDIDRFLEYDENGNVIDES